MKRAILLIGLSTIFSELNALEWTDFEIVPDLKDAAMVQIVVRRMDATPGWHIVVIWAKVKPAYYNNPITLRHEKMHVMIAEFLLREYLRSKPIFNWDSFIDILNAWNRSIDKATDFSWDIEAHQAWEAAITAMWTVSMNTPLE